MLAEGPRRIAFCHYTSDVCGGSDRALCDLVLALDRERYMPLMLLKTGDPMAGTYRAAGLVVAEIPFVSPRRALEWRKLLAFFFWFWPHALRAAWYFQRWGVHAVHVNTSNNLQGAFAARLARKPLVWHVRELVPESRAGALTRGVVALLATRAIAISTAVATSLAACGPRLRTVFDGIDLKPYLEAKRDGSVRAALGIPDTAPLVTCVGRLEPWKGQEVLIEAVPHLIAQRPDLHVLVVGGGAVNKPEYGPALRARCAALGIQDAVHFAGIRHDIPAILALSDVLVLPSASPEPFGLTVIEAMASAIPVVATAAGGPLDTVEDGITGRLIPPRDSVSMAEAILEIIADPHRARSMGDAGRQRAQARFSIARLAADLSGVFDEVCHEHRQHGVGVG